MEINEKISLSALEIAMKTMIILKQFPDDYHHIIVFMFADHMNMHFYGDLANIHQHWLSPVAGRTKQLNFYIAEKKP